jgi:hypothetical protein
MKSMLGEPVSDGTGSWRSQATKTTLFYSAKMAADAAVNGGAAIIDINT